MRGGLSAVCAALIAVGSVAVCDGASIDVGQPRRLSHEALRDRIKRNDELATYVALRGCPDWAEEVEVDSVVPLDTREVRIYYLRLDREVTFTRAYILGRPDVSMRMSERPIDPAMRARIHEDFLARHPDIRAARAAARAEAAADNAERAAESVEDAADRADQIVAHMEDDWGRSLRK